jgi:hypothetical protein
MYPSPLRDDGYDVADYTGIHSDFGTLDDFQAPFSTPPTPAACASSSTWS